MNTNRFLIGIATALVAAGALAQSLAPREHTRGAVSYLSGGIGSDEAQAMRDAAADYPLTLELAAAGGGPRDEYISDARVRIRDSQGSEVLETRTDGPFLLVRLPAGTYDVDVEWSGARKHKTVDVGERRQYVMLEFPGSLDRR